MTHIQQDKASPHQAPKHERDADRPLLAIVAKLMTPAQRHQLVQVARGVPEVKLCALYLQNRGLQTWSLEVPEEINAVWMEGPDEVRLRRFRLLRKASSWRQGTRVIKWLRKNTPAAVIVAGYHDIGRLRVLRWCWKNSVPVYVSTDANVSGDREGVLWRKLKQLYLRWIVRNISGLLVFGSAGVDYFRRYGGDDKPHFYFPHEPDYASIESLTDEQVRETRERFGIQPDRRCIVYCGRLAQAKRVDLLIDAFATIATERPEWDLLLIGDGELRASLEERVPDAVRGRIVWTGFVNEPQTIHTLYRAGDVFVLPSEHEPWGVVLAEACGAGLAVISSDIAGAAPELVRDGENGRLFRSGDVTSLVDALRDVTDPTRIDAMREATRDVLADWRERGDPVKGVRAMLADAGVIPESANHTPSEIAAIR